MMHIPDLAIKINKQIKNATILPMLCFFRLLRHSATFKMRKTRELSEFERGQIIGLWKGGKTHEAISRILKFPKSTVTDTIV
jgi:hypothetical protein